MNGLTIDAPHPTDVECPTCHAWVGWACQGRGYGYHAAGYHSRRWLLARKQASEAERSS